MLLQEKDTECNLWTESLEILGDSRFIILKNEKDLCIFSDEALALESKCYVG